MRNIKNFEEYSKQNINEGLSELMTRDVMVGFKGSGSSFDHLANEALFAKSIENLINTILNSQDLKPHKKLISKNSELRREITAIFSKIAKIVKRELDSSGQVKPNEQDVLYSFKPNIKSIEQEILNILKV